MFCGHWIRAPIKICPKSECKAVKKLKPHFDDHKTLYTKCDYMLEQCLHDVILKLDNQLKEHAILTESEIKKQKEYAKELWKLSQRFVLLTRGGICAKLYVDMVSLPAEQLSACRFTRILQSLKESLNRLTQSLEKIRQSIEESKSRFAQLDLTVESPFIVGSLKNQSIYYVRNLINDLFNYHYDVICKFKRWAQLIEINDPASVEDYQALLQASKNFRDFLIFCNKDCCCMYSKNTGCIMQPVT